MSLRASGSLANTMTLGRRKGVNVARVKVTPKLPNTHAQLVAQFLYAMLVKTYNKSDGNFQSVWQYASGPNYPSGLVPFLAKNTKALKGKTDCTDFVWGERLNGCPDTPLPTVTPNFSGFTIHVPEAPLPAGWSNQATLLALMPQTNPQHADHLIIIGRGYNSTPYTDLITGLTSGHPYVIGCVVYMTSKNGKDAYGRPSSLIATPT